jgi:mitochondrial GTPase 1
MAASTALAAAKQAVHAPLVKDSSGFIPRATFAASRNLPSAYYLGHHRAALLRMQSLLSDIGLVIECRDFRVPLTSWNPLLERTLASGHGRARIVVYTKRDLGPNASSPEGRAVAGRLAQWHRARGGVDHVVFLGANEADGGEDAVRDKGGYGQLMAAIKQVARSHEQMSLTGLRALVVGMPNAGKSTLLNRMRLAGVSGGKAARTGAQPGVTRKLGTPVKIVASEDDEGSGGIGGGVYVLDTPGVFVPHVAVPEDMLKLALVGSVKDGLIPAVTVADYLLYRLNLVAPFTYAGYCPPTNDVKVFLTGVATRLGKLGKGGVPLLENAADLIIWSWRKGNLGRFMLDEVTAETLDAAAKEAESPQLSLNQAKKKMKEERALRGRTKREAAAAVTDGP